MPRVQRRRLSNEGLRKLHLIYKTPESPEADRLYAEMVHSFNRHAFELVAMAGLIIHTNWPRWHRALQVRFLQLAAADRPSVAQAIQSRLVDGQRPHPDKLMQAVIRACMIEVSQWLKAHPGQYDVPLNGPDRFWKEAWRTLEHDMNPDGQAGRKLDSAPASWFQLLGVDYSVDSVPN